MKTHTLIFPYFNSNPISENKLKNEYPLTYTYLYSVKDLLAERSIDAKRDWFLFGRTQGLKNIEQKKIVINNTINLSEHSVNTYIVDEDVIVYACIYVVPKPTYTLEQIQSILSSVDFFKYCSIVGKTMSGGYAFASSTMIKNFGIDE